MDHDSFSDGVFTIQTISYRAGHASYNPHLGVQSRGKYCYSNKRAREMVMKLSYFDFISRITYSKV